MNQISSNPYEAPKTVERAVGNAELGWYAYLVCTAGATMTFIGTLGLMLILFQVGFLTFESAVFDRNSPTVLLVLVAVFISSLVAALAARRSFKRSLEQFREDGDKSITDDPIRT